MRDWLSVLAEEDEDAAELARLRSEAEAPGSYSTPSEDDTEPRGRRSKSRGVGKQRGRGSTATEPFSNNGGTSGSQTDQFSFSLNSSAPTLASEPKSKSALSKAAEEVRGDQPSKKPSPSGGYSVDGKGNIRNKYGYVEPSWWFKYDEDGKPVRKTAAELGMKVGQTDYRSMYPNAF